jgi:hypothetical protein
MKHLNTREYAAEDIANLPAAISATTIQRTKERLQKRRPLEACFLYNRVLHHSVPLAPNTHLLIQSGS